MYNSKDAFLPWDRLILADKLQYKCFPKFLLHHQCPLSNIQWVDHLILVLVISILLVYLKRKKIITLIYKKFHIIYLNIIQTKVWCIMSKTLNYKATTPSLLGSQRREFKSGKQFINRNLKGQMLAKSPKNFLLRSSHCYRYFRW